jgi:hypothetical protein
VAEDSVNGTTAESPEGGAAPETSSRPGTGSDSKTRDGPRDIARDPPGDHYRETMREYPRDPLNGPLRDMFRETGGAPSHEDTTPAAQFAPVEPVAPPPPIIVRQPWVIMLMIVIAILGLAGAILLGWQLRLLQAEMGRLAFTSAQSNRMAEAVSRLSDAATQANEIANQALFTATRPWIGVDVVEASPIAAGQPLNIEVRVRNSGGTPSTDMQGLFLVYISSIDNQPADLADGCQSCVRSVVLPNGVMTYRLAVRDTVMTADEVQRLKNGKDTMWIVGRLDYHDDEGELHTTKSCLHYRASGIAAFTACNDGNSAS